MPYRRRFTAKMPDFDDDITVVDVYDLASDIGKECEIIIEKFGPDAVTALLPKVINALELLENLAVRNEKENQALQELTAKISQLENDKIEKAEYRQRFEKEIEAIEEQWRTESAELVTAVARLQDENKRLRRTLNAPADGTSAPPSPAREHDQEVLSRLNSTAEKQRATLRHQELQLQEKQQLIDGLTNQVEKLAQVTRDLKRKHKQLQNQMRLVCEERSELTAIVQSQQRDITTLQQAEAQNKKCASCGASTPDGADDEDQSSKPTFSVRELRAILHERNELKLKLNRAEEQLQALQAETQHEPDSNSDTSPSASATCEDDEPPVQGPLPAEPDDAPWKRNSGIRKLPTFAATANLFRPLVLMAERQRCRECPVFASSLLSLISPWGRSRVARCPPSLAKCPRPVHPPPPPRRHSDPTTTNKQTHRRYSEYNRPDTSKLDLRQELENLNLNRQEFVGWLGNEFTENRYDCFYEKFVHDIPLQRSLSLDAGTEIFNYLQTIGSDWSGSDVGSSWTVTSDDRDSIELEGYKSFEDIPASQIKVKSRRASSDVSATFGRSYGLTVLKDSYKGVDLGSGSKSPQIKKLQRCFTFPDKLEEFMETVKESNERDTRDDSPVSNASESGTTTGLQRVKMLQRTLSSRQSSDPTISNDNFIPVTFHRSVSFSESVVKEPVKNVRQRRVGVVDPNFQGIKRDVNLRKEVLKKRNLSEFRSSEDIFVKRLKKRDELSDLMLPEKDIQFELKRTYSYPTASNDIVYVPTIVVTDDCRLDNVANVTNPDTSNSVDISSECNCRICTDEETDRRSARKLLNKIFCSIVSCLEYVRKLTYSDEYNNINESEMYECLMHVLKLMFGLWLRHLDHN